MISKNDSRSFHAIWLVILAAWSTWAAIGPRTRQDWFLENLLVWVLLIFLFFAQPKIRLSKLSFSIIYTFLFLQIYASHWGYMPPIGEWIGSLTHSGRNAFDRLMHLLFGVAFVYPIKEAFENLFRLRRGAAWLFAVLAIVSCGAVYEIIEWIVASIVNPGLGAEFIGLQGDEWDTQKDMALATVGSLIVVLSRSFRRRI